MSDYLSKSISAGRKQGFSSPDSSWFKGDSIDFVKSKLFNKNAIIYEYLDYFAVEKLIYQHLNGQVNRRLFIWSLINVNQYLDLFSGYKKNF